ncbi:shikimate dehydrogenase [bacterium]|nr:shikimate dehydrogenase [bacterium]
MLYFCNMISGETIILGVFGDPITHSYSPQLHNSVAKSLGLDCCYVAFPVKANCLQAAVQGLDALGIRGINVTVPHKETIMSFLDCCDEDALAMGAVNTIVNRDGLLHGYNTDGKGFIYSLCEYHQQSVKGKNIVFLGAGGTAKALSYTCLNQEVASLTIINRTVEKAASIKDELLQSNSSIPVQTFATADTACLEVLNQADIIVNVTSLGLANQDPLPIQTLDWMHAKQCLIDVIYNPRETRFLAAGKQKGLTVINGLAMLIAQAAYSFSLFMDVDPPFEHFFSQLNSFEG